MESSGPVGDGGSEDALQKCIDEEPIVDRMHMSQIANIDGVLFIPKPHGQ